MQLQLQPHGFQGKCGGHAPLQRGAQRPLAVGLKETAAQQAPAETQLHDELRVAAMDLEYLQYVRAVRTLCRGEQSGHLLSPNRTSLQAARAGG